MPKLYCVICGEEKPVPKCCNNQEMKTTGSYMICPFCGAIQYYPVHCSKLMKVKE